MSSFLAEILHKKKMVWGFYFKRTYVVNFHIPFRPMFNKYFDNVRVADCTIDSEKSALLLLERGFKRSTELWHWVRFQPLNRECQARDVLKETGGQLHCMIRGIRRWSQKERKRFSHVNSWGDDWELVWGAALVTANHFRYSKEHNSKLRPSQEKSASYGARSFAMRQFNNLVVFPNLPMAFIMTS